MTRDELRALTLEIVSDARRLSARHSTEPDAPVNYACIFSQGLDAFEEMVRAANETGRVVQDTATGPVFQIPRLLTAAGPLHLLKIRRPDPRRPERGDADFTVTNYEAFKTDHLGKTGWGIIQRPEMEMLELADPAFDVLAYFSNPPLATVLGLTFDDSGDPT